VLLGAVMAIGRFAPRPVRWGLALGAMALFLLLAGPQPSVGGGVTTNHTQPNEDPIPGGPAAPGGCAIGR
jgi:hypothetical protein